MAVNDPKAMTVPHRNEPNGAAKPQAARFSCSLSPADRSGMDAQLGGDVFPSDTACNRATSAIEALLTVPDMPVGERYVFPNDLDPTGIGTMNVPPIAPAVTHAVFAATDARGR